jgi:hypothetical protein
MTAQSLSNNYVAGCHGDVTLFSSDDYVTEQIG